MATDSRINPNFPIPGIDQSSRGFRDNFSVAKREIEQLQNTTIQLAGAVTSAPVVFGSSETNAVVIDTVIAGGLIALDPPNLAVQFNLNGRLTGSESLVFTGTSLGIGTNSPDASYVMDARGSLSATGNISLGSSESTLTKIDLISGSTTARISLDADSMDIVNIDSKPISLATSGERRLLISPDGNVGIGTSQPIAVLHVYSQGKDLARFKTGTELTDSMIRALTDAASSTIAWGIEHSAGNWLGGMRIDSAGTVSIHSGENAGAQLSTSSARISIDNFGKVGIGISQPIYMLDVNGTMRTSGITDISDDAIVRVGINNISPDYELDVSGDIASSGALVSRVPALDVDVAPYQIDIWPMSSYRSARYTIQISTGTSPGEQVELIECMVTHADQIPVLKVIDTVSTGSSLGSITVGTDVIDPGYAVVLYQGIAPLNRVRLAKTYIEI
jgi:hypothetical protein